MFTDDNMVDETQKDSPGGLLELGGQLPVKLGRAWVTAGMVYARG